MVGKSGQSEEKVTRRGVGAAVLGAMVVSSLPALASSGSASFVVPSGVNKIRVRSYRKGDKVIDTQINVSPGQIFRIDPV